MTGGYAYGDLAPIEHCPYCNAVCQADFVDVGVGYTQCGPFHCLVCEASEIGPNDERRELTEIEAMCGWYAPHSEPGSSANVIAGKIVDHKTALLHYRDKWEGNAEYEWPGAVEEWRKKSRQRTK